jgi:hypothetical protein
MKKSYSLKKGVGKGLVSLLSVAGALVAFTGLSDVTLVSLIEDYIFPVIGSLTVGGAVAVAVNFVKFNWLS